MLNYTPRVPSSFLEGASQPEKLIERAIELRCRLWRCWIGMVSMDRPAFIQVQSEMESALTSAQRLQSPAWATTHSSSWLPHQHIAEPARLPLLCESRQGYQNLCRLITRFKMRETTKQEGAANLR